VPLSRKSYIGLGMSIALLAALVVSAFILRRSFALTAFSDIVQSALLFSGFATFVPLASHSRGRIRLFWALIAMGVAFWLIYQLYWTYYEVVLRRDVPDLCTWDVVLFLHIVPFMAALALRPQVPRDEYAARLGQLDFALLLVWWFYLYVLVVLPWQYVVPNVAAYNRNLNVLYSAEKMALLAGLVVCWTISRGPWRRLYAALFVMSLCYSASSTVANWAIARQAYYSGSLYDIPLVAAMASLSWIGLCTRAEKPASGMVGSTVYGVWVARFSMIATFSLPLFGAWSISNPLIPSPIRVFRLALTLLAAFVMGVMIFIRQRMLDRELSRLLQHSRESFDSLKRLQAQILQSEKLSSMTQLVGGAAHELNNPITAMLGYSDLLMSTALSPEQQPAAAKIGQYVRRTKSLVASLISFARQAPAPKTSIDLNTLARTAIKLTQPQWESLHIEIRTQFDSALPKVLGDSNQLLQVCLQLLSNCLHVQSERGGCVLSLSSERNGANCVLQITTGAIYQPGSPDLSSAHADSGLGLSACQGILHEHQGLIGSEQREDGTMTLRVELPALESGSPQPTRTTAPVLWQSQPSV
jgi:signal transduction histidine kinase